METKALVDAFGRLPTSDARLRAMRALMRTLSPHEWRAVHGIAAARAFQFGKLRSSLLQPSNNGLYDIIAHLPVELVAQIISYLDTSTPYRLQPVSRQWCHILRSSAILKKSLLSWDDTLDQDSADYRLLELRAKSIHAYRHGQPKHCFKVVTHVPDHIILIADTLIWCAHSSRRTEDYANTRMINLFDIKTWKMYTLNGEAREGIKQLFASGQIVGFTTMTNVCYVSDLQGRGKKRFTVPNMALFQSIACRDRTVACAGILKDHVLVYIWNYDGQQGRSFTIASHFFPIEYARPLFTHKQGLALLLQPEDACITVFIDGRCPLGRGEECCASENIDHQRTIWYGQFDYTGNIKWDAEHFVYSSSWRNKTFQYFNNPFTPADNSGKFRICVGDVQDPYLSRNQDSSHWLQYDEQLQNFIEPRPQANPNVFWWKDTFYSSWGIPDHADHPNHPPKMGCFTLAYLGTSETYEYKPLIFEESDQPITHRDPSLGKDAIVLNNKYVIRACKDYFHMLCFEDNQHYPTADVDFFDMGSVVLTDAQELLSQDAEELLVDS